MQSMVRLLDGFAWRRIGFMCACLAAFSFFATPECVAQTSDTRVVWKLSYAQDLDKTARDEVESSVLKTLMRAKERHFVGDAILTQKLKSEGFNFPDCFTQGEPCAAGGTFVLDVYNVDAYAEAEFSRHESTNEWGIVLTLHRRFSGSEMRIERSGRDLPTLLRQVLSTLFEMEAELSIESTQPNVGVYLNKRFVGNAPVSIRITVGEQNVEFKKDGYVSQSWAFESKKGELYSKKIELVPEVTPLSVLTPSSDAQVEIDGEVVGAANATYEILPGDHTIRVSAPGYVDFEQTYKVYPGSLQTMQVALLPESESPYKIRHDNISTYRFSGFFGYRYAHESMSMKKSKAKLGEERYSYSPSKSGWASGDFNGLTLRLDYEAEYWGLSIFEFDASWASFSRHDSFDMRVIGSDPRRVTPEDGWMIGFYPAQIKGHYTFWVVQFEALLGFGVSYKHLNARDIEDNERFSLSQTAFSIHFNAGFKYYLSEETFVSVGYDFQFETIDGETGRHGVVLGLGMQIPLWQRRASTEIEDNATMSDNEDNATMGDESAEGAGTAERGDAVGLERDLGDEADELSTDSLRVEG